MKINRDQIDYNNMSGITIISLVITIIVLIILTGISISMLTGNDGIITRAVYAKFATEIKGIKEQVELKQLELKQEQSNEYVYNGTINDLLGRNDRYNDKLFVLNGELKYITSAVSSQEKGWLERLGIEGLDYYHIINFNPNINNSSLPSGYQELEYIQSTGTQYIDSGYKPSKNTGVEATFQFTDATTLQQRLFGIGSDTSVDDLFDYEFYINSNKKWGLAFSNNSGTWVNSEINADTNKHTLSFNVKNDETYFISNTTQTVLTMPKGTRTMTSSNYNLYILGRNYYYNGSTKVNGYGKVKLYSFKIYEDGVIKKNFVPCYEISSGKAGLYDTIGNEFYPCARENYDFLRDGKTYSQDLNYGTAQNLSANTFTREGYEFVGWNTAADGTGTSYTNEQNVNNLLSANGGVLNLYAIWNQNSYTVEYYPNRVGSEYREVEYIESTGSQYIDTGYYISGTTGVEAEYEYTSLTTQQRIFGTNYYQLYINGNGEYGYQFSNSTSDWKSNYIRVDKGRHKVEFNKDLRRLRFDNGNLYNNASILSGLTNTSPRTLQIMSTFGNNAKIKIYSFKIYENGELVRNFIPCYKVSDNTIGMYETIKQEFHPSSASGMLKGEDVKTSQIITIGETQNLIANPYTSEYYTFNGWNTSADGTGTSYTDGELINLNVQAGTTIDLYAQWTAD